MTSLTFPKKFWARRLAALTCPKRYDGELGHLRGQGRVGWWNAPPEKANTLNLPGKHRKVPCFWATGLLVLWGFKVMVQMNVATCFYRSKWGSMLVFGSVIWRCWSIGLEFGLGIPCSNKRLFSWEDPYLGGGFWKKFSWGFCYPPKCWNNEKVIQIMKLRWGCSFSNGWWKTTNYRSSVLIRQKKPGMWYLNECLPIYRCP